MTKTQAIEIRQATQADVRSILYIVKEAFIQYCVTIGSHTTEALLESEDDIRSDLENKVVYVACMNNTPVGSARIEKEGDKLILSRFAILTDYQGYGIGSVILSHIEEDFSKDDVKTIELYSAIENHKLKEFYLHKGFQIVSISENRGYKRGVFQKEIPTLKLN